MKKLTKIMGATGRLALLVLPMILAVVVLWPIGAAVAILAAIGVEVIWLLVLGLVATTLVIARRAKERREITTELMSDEAAADI